MESEHEHYHQIIPTGTLSAIGRLIMRRKLEREIDEIYAQFDDSLDDTIELDTIPPLNSTD